MPKQPFLAKPFFFLVLVAVTLSFLLASNRWPGWQGGIELLSLVDVSEGYLPIADAAPSFPSEPMPSHKAQRFLLPYLIGLLVKVTGAGVPAWFGFLTMATHVLLLASLWRLLSRMGLPPRRIALALLLTLLQPYAFRYYWIATGMLGDPIFMLGALWLLTGLFLRSPWFLAGGLLIAAVGRQTAVMLIPGMALYLWAGRPWKSVRVYRRMLLGTAASLLVLVIYVGTGLVSKSFSLPFDNSLTIYGLYLWLTGEVASWRGFAEHTVRCVMPLLPALVLLPVRRLKRWPAETWCAIAIALPVAAQPFLASPWLTGQNAGRLVTLAWIPMVVAWATVSREEISSRGLWASGALLAIASLHHLYTWVGPTSPVGTLGLQLFASAGLAVILALGWLRPESPR